MFRLILITYGQQNELLSIKARLFFLYLITKKWMEWAYAWIGAHKNSSYHAFSSWLKHVKLSAGWKNVGYLFGGKCKMRKPINRNVINMTKLRDPVNAVKIKGVIPSWKI